MRVKQTARVGLIILQNLFYTWKCMEICNEQRIINTLPSELISSSFGHYVTDFDNSHSAPLFLTFRPYT